MGIDVFNAGAVQSLTAYSNSVQRVVELMERAEAMPVRRFFAGEQRIARQCVLHEVNQALNDAHDAASRVQYLDGIKFSLGGKGAMVDAKLAWRSLDDVPSYATFKDAAKVEYERMTGVSIIAAGFSDTASRGQRASMLAAVHLAAQGDEVARERLRDAIRAGITTNADFTAGDTAWGAQDGLVDAMVGQLIAARDDVQVNALVHAMTASWTDQVLAPVTARVGTTAPDSRIFLDAVRSELAMVRTEHPAAQQLLASTRELIERNEARLATRLPNNSGQGYLDHPDYAELGRVQANLTLLRSISDMEQAAKAGPVAAPVRSTVDEPVGEILTW